jgi:membrane-associated phospholipid phosphatase
VLGALLKVVVGRARPGFDEPVATAAGYSFPSGHALNAAVGCMVLVLALGPLWTPRGRRWGWWVAVAVVVLTGVDRLVLGLHYLSDVLAGWSAAAALVVGTAVALGDRPQWRA